MVEGGSIGTTIISNIESVGVGVVLFVSFGDLVGAI